SQQKDYLRESHMDTDRIFKLECRTLNLTLRQGYEIEGLRHERTQVLCRRLAGRERGGGRAGGGEQSVIEGEVLRHFVGSRGSMGLFVWAPRSRPERRMGRTGGDDLPGHGGPWKYRPGHAAVLEECRMGQERYRVRGTPTLMLADGTHL